MRSRRPDRAAHAAPGPAARVRAAPDAAAAEVRRLEPLIRQELEVIDDLDRQVAALRRELAAARPDVAADLPPTGSRPAAATVTGDDDVDAAGLSAAATGSPSTPTPCGSNGSG